ncbi:hypothetical protein BH18PSE1_BH18PSE1_07660 [soil metagenome]
MGYSYPRWQEFVVILLYIARPLQYLNGIYATKAQFSSLIIQRKSYSALGG